MRKITFFLLMILIFFFSGIFVAKAACPVSELESQIESLKWHFSCQPGHYTCNEAGITSCSGGHWEDTNGDEIADAYFYDYACYYVADHNTNVTVPNTETCEGTLTVEVSGIVPVYHYLWGGPGWDYSRAGGQLDMVSGTTGGFELAKAGYCYGYCSDAPTASFIVSESYPPGYISSDPPYYPYTASIIQSNSVTINSSGTADLLPGVLSFGIDSLHSFAAYDIWGIYPDGIDTYVRVDSVVFTSNNACDSANPGVSDLSYYFGDSCSGDPGTGTAFFQWKYTNNGTIREKRFYLQIDDNSDFSSPEVNRVVPVSDLDPPLGLDPGTMNNQVTIVQENTTPAGAGSDFLNYNVDYYWRVKVEDENSCLSAWSAPQTFIAFGHPSPAVDFTYPTPVVTGQTVCFINLTQFYDGLCDINPDSCTYQWTIPPDGVFTSGTNSSTRNPCVIFSQPGLKTITLVATDSNGLSCSKTKTTLNINSNKIIPKWWGVAPF